VAYSKPKPSRLYYLLLILPFVLVLLSWWGLPILAEELSKRVFGYESPGAPTNWLWSVVSTSFYSWFIFLSIGAGSLLAVGAYLSQLATNLQKMKFYPMVSFVIPAFNEEKQLSRCLSSLFKSAAQYPGLVETIVVDDGSVDNTYEVAYASLQLNMRQYPKIRGRVVRHMANLGKIQALRSGANRALGQLIAVVDADSWWRMDALKGLVEYMRTNGKVAVTGYVHPSDGETENNPYVVLQQLEYSQGLGVFRCAQALGKAVLVVPGAMGLFRAIILRDLLNEKNIHTVTEDFEITLELQKKGYQVGYLNTGHSGTVAPKDFESFWKQRSRWFVGWLHNVLGIHKDVLLSRRWLSLLLWYILVFEYLGAFVELAAIFSFPFLFWFAPDRILFVINLLWFGMYTLLIGVISQAIALRFAYGKYNPKWLLYYTPFYALLRFINLWARVATLVKYLLGYRGNWHEKPKSNTKHTPVL
jgi:cellulose synthase/poly-beta-1,6-N-acetylglucosamine synthase-like glycosyltransferase